MRWYGRLALKLHPGEVQATLLWAGLVGALGGLSALLFRTLIQALVGLLAPNAASLEEAASHLPWWQRLLLPAAGGCCAGWVLQFGARLGHGHRSTDYMEAVAVHHGALSVRQSLVKALSSLLTISSGGSIGREGAMVQLSALVGSGLGRWGRLSTPRLRLLVACGATAGLAAVYNVTLAAALFVAEIVLGSIAMESLGPLLVAALASSLVSRSLAGDEPYFNSPVFELVSAWELLPYLALGGVLGVAAPGLVRLLRWSEDEFTRWVAPVPWRMALGGLMVGLLAVPLPEVWGNGRPLVDLALANPWPWTVLLTLLLAKAAATAATTGSGAVGGVFTPTLFLGALLGGLVGHVVAALWPGWTAGPQAYALVGMGGLLAAATRAPLTAMLMLFEMTLDFSLLLPLLAVCVVAYYTARSLQSDSIYSESLRRKQPHASPARVSTLTVRDLLKPAPATVLESTPFAEIARLFANQPYRHLAVVTLQNQLQGIIALREVENHLQRHGPDTWATAAGLMRTDLQVVTPETSLGEALEAFHRYHGERLPVISDPRERRLLGYISKTDLLLTLAHGLHGGPH